ncbi:MAG: hypothetical protein AB1705_07610 [Verrucomicrobiota bacterium]
MRAWFVSKSQAPHWLHVLGVNPRKLLAALLVLALMGGLAVAGRHYYRSARLEHLVRQAETFLKQKDARSAGLSARSALQLDPNHLAATRIMARLADEARNPAALLWHQRVVELGSNQTDDLLALANCALRENELPVAEEALLRVKPAQHQTAAFHQTAGAFALTASRPDEAARHFAEAVRLDPRPLNQLNLAMVQLSSINSAMQAHARTTLESLRTTRGCEALALRALFSDARRSSNASRAILFGRDLLASAGAAFSDRVHVVDALAQFQHADLENEIQRAKVSATHAGDLAELMFWLNAHGRARDTEAWFNELPPARRNEQPVPLAMAEADVTLKQWPALRARLAEADWQELNFMRHAFLARAAREEDDRFASSRWWRQALTAVGNGRQPMAMLARQAQKWRWDNEAEELWWRLARGNAGQRPALAALHRLYSERRDARNLLRVANRILELNPDDLVARNNVAVLSLLLGENAARAHQLAQENFTRSPKNAAFVSTYALSLHLQNKPADAARLLEELPESQLEHPSIAALYGAILHAAGDQTKAGAYLARADGNKALFPEEQMLVSTALRQSARR